MTDQSISLKDIQKQAEEVIKSVNAAIDPLGDKSRQLYDTLGDIQKVFDQIRNVPTKKMLEYQRIKKIRLNWKEQVEKIQEDARAQAGGGHLWEPPGRVLE